MVRITTWNVNGIRNPFAYEPWRSQRSLAAMFDTLGADVVVLQETKIQRRDLRDDMVLVPGWDVFFSLPRHKRGYSGVAVYTRTAACCPVRAEEGLTGVLCPPRSTTAFRDAPDGIGGYPAPESTGVSDSALDAEGRCLALEFPAFVLLGVYAPAARPDRAAFRRAFLAALDARVRNLVALGKHVVVAGDLNLVASALDAAGDLNPALDAAGDLNPALDAAGDPSLVAGAAAHPLFDLCDLCRDFHPRRAGMYTCWDTRKNARPGNFGSRIDYVLCSRGLRAWFAGADIQEGLLGSDHCPVWAALADVVDAGGRPLHVLDRLNPPGMVVDGVRREEWLPKRLLPLSARLMPEFDRRRSIRDMFARPPGAAAAAAAPPGAPAAAPPPPRGAPAGAAPPAAAPAAPLSAKRPAPPRRQGSLLGFFKRQKKETQAEKEAKETQADEDTQKAEKAEADEDTQKAEKETQADGDNRDTHKAPAWPLGKRLPPPCEHGEPCISLLTRKPGVNCGRSFYICARPLGPSGDKEAGTPFRCRTFVWSSDWP